MDYDYSKMLSTGGATGTYHVASPWGGECEVRLVAVSAKTGAGVTINTDGSDTALPDTNVASGLNAESPFPGIMLNFATNQTIGFPEAWSPVTNKQISILVSGAAAWVVVQFRRAGAVVEQSAIPPTLPPDQQHDGYYFQQLASEARRTQVRG